MSPFGFAQRNPGGGVRETSPLSKACLTRGSSLTGRPFLFARARLVDLSAPEVEWAKHAARLGSGCRWFVRARLRPAPTGLAYGAGNVALQTSEVSTDLGGPVGVHPPPSSFEKLRTGLPSREGSQYWKHRGYEGSSAGLPPPRWGRIEEGVVPPRAGPKSSATGGETGFEAGFLHSRGLHGAVLRRRRVRVFLLCFPDIDGQPVLCYNTSGGCRV